MNSRKKGITLSLPSREKKFRCDFLFPFPVTKEITDNEETIEV